MRLRDMNLGALFRLTLCLVLLHGYGHVASEEMNGGCKEEELRNTPRGSDMTGQVPWKSVGEVAGGEAGKVEGDGKPSGISATGDGRAMVLVVDGTGEAVDEAGEDSATVGGCAGTRFKKCR